MMLPLETGPEWMQVLSKLNPLTYMVEAERVLFTGHLGVEVLWGAVAASLTAGLGLRVGIRAVTRTDF